MYCGVGVWINDAYYHDECTHCPEWVRATYAPTPSIPGCVPVETMTEERIREIIREELAKGRQ